MAEQQPLTLKKGDTVVIAVDGSEYSDYAFNFYREELYKPEDTVYLVHSTEVKTAVMPGMAMMSGDPAVGMITQEIESAESHAGKLVDELTIKLKEVNLTAEIIRNHGEAGPAVIQAANEKHADYIVVGCRGKGTIRRTITGSVTDYIVHHAHVPVLVAKHKDHMKHHGHHGHHDDHHKHKK